MSCTPQTLHMHPTYPFGHRPSSEYLIVVFSSLDLQYNAPDFGERQCKVNGLKQAI